MNTFNTLKNSGNTVLIDNKSKKDKSAIIQNFFFFLQNMNREGVILFLIIVASLLHANSDIWWNDIALLKKSIPTFRYWQL